MTSSTPLPGAVVDFEDRVEIVAHKSLHPDAPDIELEDAVDLTGGGPPLDHLPRRTVSDPCVDAKWIQFKPMTRRKGSKHKTNNLIAKEVQVITTREAVRELIKCAIFALGFAIMLSLPKLVGQPAPSLYMRSVVKDHPIFIEAQHSSEGLLSLEIIAGECETTAADHSEHDYTLVAKLAQDGQVLDGRTRTVTLHSSAHGRRLSGGGGTAAPINSATLAAEFDISASLSEQLGFSFETDCPSPIPLSISVRTLGIIGRGQEWIALILLIVVLVLILTEIVHRTLAAFLGAAGVLVALALEHRLPTVSTIIGWMDHGTLALLWGMMIIVALLSRTGVFEWCAVRVFESSGGSMWKLYAMLMVFCAVVSAFLDNVTTILLLGPVIISLCKAIRVDPKPMLISLALFGNIGGTATMIGDPPNIIIGNAFSDQISFMDFLLILGPGVVLSMPPALLMVRRYYGASYFSAKLDVDLDKLKETYPIREPKLLIQAGAVLGACIVMFFLHPVHHLDPAYTACCGATLLLVLCDHHDFDYAISKVEWDSLLFFAGLFVFTEGIAELGLLREIANMIIGIIEGIDKDSRQLVANILIQLVAAVASAFVDNIPFTTTMIPVLRQTAANVDGLTLEPLIWSLAFGACMGGMGTLIGASANVVMSGIAEEAGYHVYFGEFFKIGWPMMCLTTGITCVYMIILQSIGVWD